MPHFKWANDARSDRRIHKTPNAGEIRACFPWLEHEIALIKPEVIVCLGAAAEAQFIADIKKVGKHFVKPKAGAKRAAAGARRFSAWPTTAARSRTSSASTRSSRK